jgi:1-acyl-sn-glycerol-3-phosphate acyltransferase
MCLYGIILSFFYKDDNIIHRRIAIPWAKIFLKVCGVKVEVKGAENVNRDLPCIYMSNHQSYFDIFTLLAGLPADFKFIMKKSLMRIPLLGTTMRRAGYLSVDRRDRKSAIISMDAAAALFR